MFRSKAANGGCDQAKPDLAATTCWRLVKCDSFEFAWVKIGLLTLFFACQGRAKALNLYLSSQPFFLLMLL